VPGVTAPFSWHLTRRLFPKVAQHVADLEGALEAANEAKRELEAERERLLQEAGRLAAMLDATPDFVALSRLDGTIVYLNQGGRRLLGLGDEDLSRVKQAALCPPWVYERTEQEWLPKALREGHASGKGAFLARDGREVPVSFVMSVHRDEAGEPTHLSTIARDMTAQIGRDRALREKDELLRRATEASRLIVWQMDLGSGVVKCSANAEAVWGHREGPLESFIARVHPQDRDVVRVEARALTLGQPELSLEYRVIHPSGAMRWLHSTGVAVADEEGTRPARVVGVSADVTHRRVADEALRDSERRVQAAVAERDALAARNARLEAALREAKHAREAIAGALARELRDPLYPLLNAVQLLGLPGQETRLPALREMMQRQLERLVQALDGLSAPHAAQGQEPPPAPPAESAQRILVVDDNQDAARSLAMLLKALGADAQVAHDGPQALDMVPSYRPSAVLLDIGMPGMDGYEVARRIREREPDAAPVLIALTGRGQEEEGRRAEEAGFDRYFVKPADVPVLQSLLASLPAQPPAGG
jgi:PAS domain S-box-containing protein